MLICQSSPVGPLGADAHDGAITALHWGASGNLQAGALFDLLASELDAYFKGQLPRFSVPLAPKGTPFQRGFYAALCEIPFGQTRTYGDLAKMLGVPAQAIGQACGANPVPILIPCHRILAADGLGGYSGKGGIEAKVTLLKIEGAAGLLI